MLLKLNLYATKKKNLQLCDDVQVVLVLLLQPPYLLVQQHHHSRQLL